MTEADGKRLSLDLIEIAKAAYVSTVDLSGFPQTRAMFNLRRKTEFPALSSFFAGIRDDVPTYFTTNTSSSKIVHIKANPKGCVYYSEPDEFRGLLLSGEFEIVSDRKIKEALWQEGWEIYYPGGPHDPDHTVLMLRPAFGRYYHRLDTFNFNFKKRK